MFTMAGTGQKVCGENSCTHCKHSVMKLAVTAWYSGLTVTLWTVRGFSGQLNITCTETTACSENFAAKTKKFSFVSQIQ